MTEEVRGRFITAEHERTLVRECDGITLRRIMVENEGKSGKYCLQELVSRIYTLQVGLPKSSQR